MDARSGRSDGESLALMMTSKRACMATSTAGYNAAPCKAPCNMHFTAKRYQMICSGALQGAQKELGKVAHCSHLLHPVTVDLVDVAACQLFLLIDGLPTLGRLGCRVSLGHAASSQRLLGHLFMKSR